MMSSLLKSLCVRSRNELGSARAEIPFSQPKFDLYVDDLKSLYFPFFKEAFGVSLDLKLLECDN